MWLLILMSGKWYAREYDCLSDNIDDVFEHVNNANVVCIADDLEWWCDEMDVERSEVIIVEAE